MPRGWRCDLQRCRDQVLARAEADGAPFSGSDELKAWVVRGLTELS
jgi:hypothetical protein